jgi:hypothetical protein
MALPDTIKTVPGTAVIWGQASATGVTNVLSLNALADGTARMGVYADLGASWDMEYSVMLVVEPTSQPTAGTRVDLYLPCTHSLSYWPNEVTGADAAWPADSNEDEHALQLGPPACSLISCNDDRVQVQAPVFWRPTGRYVAPVVDNNLGVAFNTDGTPADNKSRVILIPLTVTVTD